jgi:hypothetical protein
MPVCSITRRSLFGPFAFHRRLRVEQLEERRLLAADPMYLSAGLAQIASTLQLSVETPEPSAGSQMLFERVGPVDVFVPGDPIAPEPLAPPLLGSFDAANYATNGTHTGFSFIPPDPHGAVGPNHVVNVVNVSIEWYTKSGTQQNSQSLQSFFAPLAPVNFTFDPKVIYDQHADRWVVVTLERQDSPATSRILAAVSDDSDPNGTWHYSAINSKINISGADRWADYPGLAVDDQAIYITNNMFGFGLGGTYGGVRLWIVHKGLGSGGLYDGGVATVSVHNPYATAGIATTTQPAHVFGDPGGSVGTFLVSYSGLASGGNEFVQVVRVNNPLTSPTFSQQYVAVGDIENSAAAMPDAPQLGTIAMDIETNDRRALNAVWRDNRLWMTAQVVPSSGIDAGETTAHWWNLNTTSLGSISVNDQGNVGGDDLVADATTFFPSIMVDAAGNMALGFSISAATIYGSAAYTTRLLSGPAGFTETPGYLAQGLAEYQRTFGSGSNRWGDYSGIALDPSDESTFWVYNEYAWTTSGSAPENGRWATRWGKFTTATAPTPDIYEPNDSFAAAYNLGTLEDFSDSGLSIHAASNDDYFRFTAGGDGVADISIGFSHAAGDVDLVVYDASQTLIGFSTSTTDDEFVSVPVVRGEVYYVHVYGYSGAINPNYSLDIDAPSVPADIYEANDTFAGAYDLGTLGNFFDSGLSIHAANNDDYFRFTAVANGQADIGIAFSHAAGDVDLEVYDASETLIDLSVSVTDSELVSIPVMHGETYYVRVYGYAGAVNPIYDLDISFTHSGDYNGDNSVDAADYILWRKMLNQSVAAYTGADGSGDGIVGPEDHVVWTANFGQTLPMGSGSSVQKSGTAKKGQSQFQQPEIMGSELVLVGHSKPDLGSIEQAVRSVAAEPPGKVSDLLVPTRILLDYGDSLQLETGRAAGSRRSAQFSSNDMKHDAGLLAWVASHSSGEEASAEDAAEPFERWQAEEGSAALLLDALDSAFETLSADAA